MLRDILRRGDTAIGLALLAFGGWATWIALAIARGPTQRTLAPNVVPLICTIGIALCGAVLLIRGVLVAQRHIVLPFDRRQAAVGLAVAGFLVAFPHVDYRLLTFGFVALVMVFLGCRSPWQLALVPAGAVLGIWLFFVELFDVFLPTWI